MVWRAGTGGYALNGIDRQPTLELSQFSRGAEIEKRFPTCWNGWRLVQLELYGRMADGRGENEAMGDGREILDIKIADIKRTAPHFSDQSIALARALTKLKHGLSAAGTPWGDDKQGEALHKVYGPLVKRIEHSTQTLSDGLASIHQAMADMADGHVDNDELIRSMFSRIHVAHDAKGESK